MAKGTASVADGCGLARQRRRNASTRGWTRPTLRVMPKEPAPRAEPLLSSVCHDLRAPLAAVQMGASFVLQATPDAAENARTRKILEAVLRSCTQMDRLLRNFSDIAHVEAKDVVLDLVDQDARRVAEIAVASAAEAARAREVEVRLHLPEDAISLRADRERLARAVGHLVENAIRHGPIRAVVDVAVRVEGDRVIFAVDDDGTGPSEEVRGHLDDRAWLSTRAGRTGSGVGLAVARGFAALHGGGVRLAGAPDGGTRFELLVDRNATR